MSKVTKKMMSACALWKPKEEVAEKTNKEIKKKSSLLHELLWAHNKKDIDIYIYMQVDEEHVCSIKTLTELRSHHLL